MILASPGQVSFLPLGGARLGDSGSHSENRVAAEVREAEVEVRSADRKREEAEPGDGGHC